MNLLDILKQFNRKERFHLLHHALGYESQSFRLGHNFRNALASNLGLRVPHDALVMMDYHLDWIGMAVWLRDQSILPTKQAPATHEGRVSGNQEDVDLLVAFESDGTTHMVFIEAKGDTAWNNQQLRSKAKRLTHIFGSEISKTACVQPHFVLLSPTASTRIDTGTWPSWMRRDLDHWMTLPWPSTMKPTLCNEDGSANRHGDWVRIDQKKGD